MRESVGVHVLLLGGGHLLTDVSLEFHLLFERLHLVLHVYPPQNLGAELVFGIR